MWDGTYCHTTQHCFISAIIRTVDSQSDLRILLELWLVGKYAFLLQKSFLAILMLISRKPVQRKGIGEKCGFFHYSPAVTKGLMWLYANNMYLPVCLLTALLWLLRDLRNFSADKNFLERMLQGKTCCASVRISLLDKHYSPPCHIPCIYILCILVFFSTPLQFWEFIYLKLHNFSVSNLGWMVKLVHLTSCFCYRSKLHEG